MSARTPQDVHRLFTEAFGKHDLEALMALYDEDAVMMPGPGEAPVRGHAAIRAALEGLLAMKPREARLETVFSVERDDLAMMRSRWAFVGTGPDGEDVEMTGGGSEVMRRRPDGTWVHLIDYPWGASVE